MNQKTKRMNHNLNLRKELLFAAGLLLCTGCVKKLTPDTGADSPGVGGGGNTSL